MRSRAHRCWTTASKRSPSSSAPALAVAHCAAAVLLGAAAANAQVPRFTGVGDLAGGTASSAALGVSSDGSVVVGESESASGTQAFRWTSAGGIAGLGFLSGVDPYSTARAVSANGAVIVGTSRDANTIERAYRWSSGVMTALNTFSCADCEPITQAFGVSGNGLTVVGSALARSGGTAPIHLDPVRWPNGGTGIVDLGNLSGGLESGEAFGASTTGSLIVGSHVSGDGLDAWYWNGSGGLHVLPTITGGSIISATAFAISADGTTIVGHSNQDTVVLPGGTELPTDLQAVRWTGANFATLTQLGSLPGAPVTDSSALAVSTDGTRIVGRAVDADVSDRAFLWDAANGMRDLKTVLEDDYGLDVSGWVLQEATGISAVTGGTTFTVVGRGLNPQGEPEGWVAFVTPPGCSDGLDNDGDTFTDHPADPQCTSPTDWTEQHDCDDGVDNDGDGLVDHPADGGCRAEDDATERPDCANGLDDDGDGDTDHPADPGCAGPAWPVEDPDCENGVDDDTDLLVDHPDDAQCTAPSDLSETPDCSDGLDNDFDGLFDHPADPSCATPSGPSEAAECGDGLDNDGDGRIDWPAQYPGCTSAVDPIEAAQCSDGIDNDGDTFTDHPADPGCAAASSADEDPVALAEGDLIAVDRASAAVFRVDVATGAQTLISQGALLTAPQGIAVRIDELVVADPAGLVTVQGSGVQRVASPPLVPKDSLQVVFDAAQDAYVLEEREITKVAWSTSGIGAKSVWLQLPTPGPIPALGDWHGDSIAVEANGDFVVGGFSLWGDGVYRITTAPVASILRTGFEELRWLDLAVEADGTILAAGFKYNVATGVYRVDPVTGESTPLNNTYAWERPAGIAIAPNGDVFVADAGVCSDGTCAGGEIVRVDPVSGAVTPLASGGFIAGELDLVVLPEPGALAMWVAGAAAVAALAHRRSSRRARR